MQHWISVSSKLGIMSCKLSYVQLRCPWVLVSSVKVRVRNIILYVSVSMVPILRSVVLCFGFFRSGMCIHVFNNGSNVYEALIVASRLHGDQGLFVSICRHLDC